METQICLYRDQDKIPSDTDKDDLLKAGLSEKVIEFDVLDIDADDFCQVILEAYPQLKNAGGYTFFKCAPNSLMLEPLSQIVMSSPCWNCAHLRSPSAAGYGSLCCVSVA